MTNPFISTRDHRFEYAGEAIEFIERANCAKGCTIPTPVSIAEFGPGGDCPLLATVAVGDGTAIHELDDHGRHITCLKRQPPPIEPTGQTGPDLFGNES